MNVQLRLATPSGFSFWRSVCSYGFYMLAPNAWTPPHDDHGGTLERPLRLKDGRAVITSVWQDKCELVVRVHGIAELDEEDQNYILEQVKRMLRLSPEADAAVDRFHAVHPEARLEQFGRLFRSPTLFEDMIKSLLLCNCGWPRTLDMSRALCELQAELRGPPIGYVKKVQERKVEEEALSPPPRKKLKTVFSRSTTKSRVKEMQERFSSSMEEAAGVAPEAIRAEAVVGAFPTADELADLDPLFLGKRCSLGYRVSWVLNLAKDVASGVLQLNKFEGPSALQGEELRAAVRSLQGFGPFSAANVMMLLGNYDVIPADSETIRHLKHFHGKQNLNSRNVGATVAAVYERYKPFEFLAYWWEIWRTYEQRFGSLAKMPAANFRQITGVNMRKRGLSGA